MNTPTAEFVRGLLDYRPETGEFRWRENSRWSRAGALAGALHVSGSISVSIKGKLLKAHRLAWLYVHGEWPEGQIDHINGIRGDNRIANLRLATSKENQQNRRRANKNSQSGLLGVSWDEARGLWQSRIKVDGRQLYIGRFDSTEAAHAAYLAAKAKVHPFQTICEAAA